MLTQRMMIQAIADRLAGTVTPVNGGQFVTPWRECWDAVSRLPPETNPTLVATALLEALQGRADRDEVIGKIMAAQPGTRLHFESLADIAGGLAPIEFVWPQWIPRGMLTVFGASQGAGKSFVGLDLAYRVINGKEWPDGSQMARPGANVIYVDAEAVPQILNERAANYGVDRSKLFLMVPESGEMIDFGSWQYQDRLVEMAAALQPELVIIDSLSSVHSRGQNNVEDVRGLMSYLTQLAAYYRLGLILIHHIRKTGPGQQMLLFDLSMEDLSGSGHITAMARVVWGLHVVQTGPDPDPNGPRELKMLKTNLGPYADPLGFTFEPLHPKGVFLKWGNAPERFRAATKVDSCEDWLEEMLQSADGPLKPSDLVTLGELEGFSRAMIYRARKGLGSKVHDTEGHKSPGNAWEWVG